MEMSADHKNHDQKNIILFDFDQTIVNGHFHNALTKEDEDIVEANKAAGCYNGAEYMGTFHNLSFEEQHVRISNLINKFGIKNHHLLLNIIRTAIKEGHKIGIVNFTSYPQGILPSLQAMGLNEQELSHFKKPGHIVAWLPMNQREGKKQHILEAIKKIENEDGVTYDLKQVIFLDDLYENISAAQNDPELGGKGLVSILVPQEPNAKPEYLMRLIKEAHLPINSVKEQQ